MTDRFNKLHHLCVVVHDIDKAQAYCKAIGIGPWMSYPPLPGYTELDVPSRTGFAYYDTVPGAGVVLLTRTTGHQEK